MSVRSKMRGLWPAAAFTAAMLALVGIGAAVIAAGQHYQGVSIITLGVWTWGAWAAGYGMHAWKRHAEVIGEIRASMKRMETMMLADEQRAVAGAQLRVVPPLR